MYIETNHELSDKFRKQILAVCTTPKTCAQICKVVSSTPRILYNHLKALSEQDNLKKIIAVAGNRTRVSYETINSDYKRIEYVKQRINSEKKVGHFFHRIENFEAQHKATSKLTRENYKTGRNSIGISSVYDG